MRLARGALISGQNDQAQRRLGHLVVSSSILWCATRIVHNTPVADNARLASGAKTADSRCVLERQKTMNYFAHGIRFLDRPWFLAGTALPDWLSVVDRRVRLRPKGVAPFADGSASPEAELAAGALQHFEDDHWFHKTRAFAEATGRLTDLFRNFMGPGDGFRCGFLGHITSELLLDAILIKRYPERLDAYYQVLAQLDARRLAAAVMLMAGKWVDLCRGSRGFVNRNSCATMPIQRGSHFA